MDNKIDKAIEPICKYFSKIQTDLLKKIIEHFMYNDEFINSDLWRIKKLEELGVFNEEIVKYIAKVTSKSPEMIRKCLNNIGIETIKPYKSHIKGEMLTSDIECIRNNKTLNKIMENAFNESNSRFIQMSSRIKEAVVNTYLNVVEENYLKTSMGTHSYQESIIESIDRLAKEGIRVMTYTYQSKDGNTYLRNYDIPSTVRREILTATRQLSANFNMELIENSDAKKVYISEHLDCRPQHFDWQGTIIPIENITKPLPDYPEYGSIIGIYGINCRHYFEPYFGDETGDNLKKYTREECEERYNQTQHQRNLERKIRKWKLREELSKKAGVDNTEIDKCHDKVLEWQKEIDNFTKENKLKRDFTREYIGTDVLYESERKGNSKESIVNWNTINSQEYRNKFNITENKKVNEQIYNISRKVLNHRDGTLKEDMYLLNSKNGNVLASQTNMKTNLHITYNPQMKKAIEKNKNIITIHNHPLSMPPSINDLNSAFERKYKLGVIIAHDGTIYTYNIKRMKQKIVQREYDIAVEKFTKLYYNNSKKGQMEALNQLSKLYDFEIKEVV